MECIWEEIYEKVIYQKEHIQKAEQKMEKKIHSLINSQCNVLTEVDMKMVKEWLYYIQYQSLREGVLQGVKMSMENFKNILVRNPISFSSWVVHW